MLSTSRRRGLPAALSTIVAATTASVVAVVATLVVATPGAAAGICATPGSSGAGGTLAGVVNTYYPGSTGTVLTGASTIPVGAPVGAATPIAAGDLLLVISMQGATIDSTNTDAYGDGVVGTPASGSIAPPASGRYEYVRATSAVVLGSVSISGTGPGAGLLYPYTSAAATSTSGQRRFQVVRVPQYTTATTSSTLTAAPWNGTVGGVLALDTTGSLTLNGTVSVDGLGFRGGLGIQRGGGAGLLNTDVVTSSGSGANGTKGEGIAGVASGLTTSNGYPGGDTGRGAPGNAGGGGTDGRPSANDENTGGGGGGNGGAGGIGGNSWNSNLARGGFGGSTVPATIDRVFLGGGGGAGTGNNFTAPNSNGAAGGGLVLIRAGSVSGGGTITANGAAAYSTTANDGGGGGGAGGSILLTSPSGSLAGATLAANGGRGGNAWATQAGATSAHGPGGGGGGGVIITSSAPTSTSVLPGQNGITTTGSLAFGSAPGLPGITATAAPSSVPGVSGGAECANLSIVKTGPTTVTAGGSLTYSLTVANAGPADASAVSVLDTLPAGVTFVSALGSGWVCTPSGNVSITCTRTTVANGATAPAITVVVSAPPQAGTATNTASVTAATADPVPGDNTSSTSTTVVASADVSIVKSGPATVVAGASVGYTLAVANAGPSDAATVSVTDTLPAGVAFGSASGTGWSCSYDGIVTVTCTRAAVAAGTSAPPISVTVTAPAQGASLSNSASVSSATPDANPANNTSSVPTTVTAVADLAIVKTGTATVVAGGSVSYTLTVSNAGPSDAALVSVTDTLPSGVTFGSASGSGWSCSNSGNVSVTCSRPTLATGTSAPALTVVVTAPAQATTLSNTASVASATADPRPGDNTANASTTVTASADLSITKSGPASVVAGQPVSYTLDVANAGPSDAVSVSVTDTLPAGVTFVAASGAGWTCTPAGSTSVTCTRPGLATATSAPVITVVVTAPAYAVTLSNSASVSSATADPVSGNNAASASTVVTASADVSVLKSGPATLTASGSLVYQVDAANAGPSDAQAVSIVDTLPAGVTFVAASGTGWSCTNAANVSVTCTRSTLTAGTSAPSITVEVTAPAQPSSVTNSVSIASTTPDPDLSDNASSVTTDITGSADLSISKTGPATVVAGDEVTYQLVVANGGPSDAVDVLVTDTLPAGVAFVSTSGAGWSCTHAGDVSVTCTRAGIAASVTVSPITVVVTAPDQATSLSNTASVSSTTADPDPGNNTSGTTTAVTASADLAISKSGPATVTAGGALTYTLTVRNRGPSDAADVSVLDTLPPGVTYTSATGSGWSCSHAGDTSVTCTRPTLASSSTAPVITVVVTAPGQASSLTNTAAVSSSTADPDTSNNSANATTDVIAVADVRITKSGPATVAAGGTLSYTLLVENLGPSDAAGVSVTDTLPAGVAFVSAAGAGWSCSHLGDVSVTCTRAQVAASASAAAITITVMAPAQPTAITNTASVASTTADPDPGNNSDTATTTVTASADLSITKVGPPSVTASGTVTYTLSVRNHGPSDATSLTMLDTLPAGVSFVSAAGTGWLCSSTGDVSVTCTRPLLPTGDTAPLITVVVAAPTQTSSLTNTSTITSPTPDPVTGNNTSTTTTSVIASADLSIVKSGPPTVDAAGTVTYALLVANDGPSDADSVSVTDTLPAGVTFVSAVGSGWLCANAGSTSVTCTRLLVAASTTAPAISIVVAAPAQASSLTNSASVTSATADPDLTNNASSVSTGVAGVADLAIVKSGPASVVAGSSVSYSLVVTNAGPSDASSVSVTDTLPAGVTFGSASGPGWTCLPAGDVSVTCTRPSLGSGATAPTISVVVVAPAQPATLVNVASVASVTADPDLSDNTDGTSTVVTASADLSLVKSGPLTSEAGASITYVLTVTNHGPSDAVAVRVTDTLPSTVTFVSASGSGWTCGSPVGATVVCTRPALAASAVAPSITVNVTAPESSSTITNSAVVDSTTPDPVPANNDSTVVTQVAGSADLSLVKSGPPQVLAGDLLSYSLVVRNDGPDDAVTVEVIDTLPVGVTFRSASGPGWSCTHAEDVSVTCTLASLASGATAEAISVVVRAPGAAGQLLNTATVSSSTSDPVPANNTAFAPTTVVLGGGGNPGDNGSGGGGNGDPGLPQTGAAVVRDLTAALLMLLVGIALVLVARPGSRRRLDHWT